MNELSDFIAGAWLTVTLSIITYMILLGRKCNRLEIELEKEKTRSIEVDKGHTQYLNRIDLTIQQIDNKMNTVLLAYQDTKEMLIARINEKT